MAQADSDRAVEVERDAADDAVVADAPRRRGWRIALLVLLALVVAALAAAWFSRERIAGNVIAGQLKAYGIPATYKIASIGPERQVLTDIVVGDPRRPDLTVERAEVRIRYRLGYPAIGRITVTRPRLYGSYRGGALSFGSLDKVLFRKTTTPPGLPKLDLRLIDGRALLETDYGPVGVKADGAGRLDSGFAGIVAVAAPQLAGGGCAADKASLYGKLTTAGGKPRLVGPLRVARLDCAASGLALRDAAVALDAKADKDFAGFDGQGRLQTGALAYGATHANGINGSLTATWRDKKLAARYSLAARGLAAAPAQAALLTAEGSLRGTDGLQHLELQSDLEANGVRMGEGLDRALAGYVRAADGTLLAPILTRIRGALAREGKASQLSAALTLRKTGAAITAIVPQAALRGGSGDTLLAVSRFSMTSAGSGPPRLAGNLATGGVGLPRIVGRMERSASGGAVLRMRMAEYRAGPSSLEIPELVLAQPQGGTIGFAGRIRASGALPGGSAQGLVLPVEGAWTGSRLSLWRRCIAVGFDRLTVASLTLEERGLNLCPAPGRAIIEQDARGLRIAAGSPSLDLAGRLASTPVRLRTGAVGFAYPGAMSAKQVEVVLGPAATASRFTISNLDATFGREIGGKFGGADIRLFAVPLNLMDASGTWRYAGGKLGVAGGVFRLVDRTEPGRFKPLAARDGTLTLADNVIRANALLREPRTDRVVTQVDVLHNLASGRGHADLAVPGLQFDKQLQPDQLSPMLLGVIANANGVITGSGHIEWTEKGVTSTGRFSSDNLDFAAAFGPVKGASGTIEFTDLLNLTTAPNQKLHVASINPGIEVTDGEITFALRNGKLLAVEGATWPFMGGTLTLRKVDLNFGVSEERRYVFDIVGLQAAEFVQRMDLANLSATGTFDGTIPIVFDASGTGRIENGVLDARPPGGNISYVGALSYKDMGAIANFAFDALKSLDFKKMHVEMNGNLTGEIVTRVSFDGVKQGAGAKRNFLTKRFENLPIRFNINIKAPFYQLITSIKAMYDPASVRDPRELGLLTSDGKRLKTVVTPAPPAIKPDDIVPDTKPIQNQESEKTP